MQLSVENTRHGFTASDRLGHKGQLRHEGSCHAPVTAIQRPKAATAAVHACWLRACRQMGWLQALLLGLHVPTSGAFLLMFLPVFLLGYRYLKTCLKSVLRQEYYLTQKTEGKGGL